MIVVFTGGYGSGKTETALNYALCLAGYRSFDSAELRAKPSEDGADPVDSGVTLIDLDVIKPYFRSREVRDPFREYGIKLISSMENFEMADVPALSPAIQSTLRLGERDVVIDLGGEAAGARVLRRFASELGGKDPSVLLMANPYRPFTGTPRAIETTASKLSEEIGLPLAGLVANPHLIDGTTVETVVDGLRVVETAAALCGLPLAFLCVAEHLAAAVREVAPPCPIFPLARFVLPPWARGVEDAIGKMRGLGRKW